MKAKDFRKEQGYPYNHFTKLTSTGISPDYDNIEAFAEAYHKSKVDTGENNALLPDVTNCPLCGHGDYFAPSENCSNPTCKNHMGF